MELCSPTVEEVWGPRVHGCGTNFDLTLLFQESILFLGPLGVAICWSSWRIFWLRDRKPVVASPLLYALKIGTYVLFIISQIALIAVQSSLRTSNTRATVAASSVGIAGSAVLLILSHYEHCRTIRASTILLFYFGYSTLANALRARTLWSMPRNNTPVAAIFTAISVIGLLLLALELTPKTIRSQTAQPSPEERANVFSRAFLWWLLPVFKLGARNSALTAEELPEIDAILTHAGETRTDGQVDLAGSGELKLSRPSVFLHLLKTRGVLLLSPIPARLVYIGFEYAQPFLVRRATEFVSEPVGTNTYKIGGGLIGAYFIVYVGLAATQAFYRQATARGISAVRADLVTLVYSHTLRLSSSSSSRDAASTLMSADVEQFSSGSRNMHECWACIIEVALGLWLLEEKLGIAIAATGGLTASFIGITLAILVTAGKRQNAWLKGMEVRVAAVTQALHAMRGVKMTGIASVIRQDLLKLRRTEGTQLTRFRHILLIVAWAMWIPVIVAPILGFSIYATIVGPRIGGVLNPALVFQCLTIFSLFGDAIANLIQSAINLFTAAAALVRIQTFLLDDNTRTDDREILKDRRAEVEQDKFPLLPTSLSQSESNIPLQPRRNERSLGYTRTALSLAHAYGGWSTAVPSTIQDANLELSNSGIVAVVGPVGCGKTTLLHMLLGETSTTDGTVSISAGPVGFCSQTPWLTHDSIRKNIVGSSELDEGWYNTVVKATALDHDIAMMASENETVVGNEGGGLSGGQKKRIALARAIYSRCPIIILDDPFNGLDARTEAFTLEAVLGRQGLLRRLKALVVWATSTAKQVSFADRIISLSDTGSLQKKDSLLLAARQVLTGQEDDLPSRDTEQVKHDGEYPDQAARPLSTLEVVQGLVVGSLPPQMSESKKVDTTATASSSIYRYYIGAAGRRKFVIFVGFCSIFVFGITFTQYWITHWSEQNAKAPGRDQSLYIGIYAGVGAIQLLAWTAAAFFFIKTIAEKCADHCHRVLLDTVLGAPMSFFDFTDAGSIINRFSQDLQLMDTELPYDMMGVVNQVLVAIGQCGLIIYGSPWAGIAIPIVGLAVYFLQKAYLPTSRQLRVLEIEAKGPLFSHFLETLNGLVTIRALGWSEIHSRKNADAVMASQKPFFLLFTAQNWLNLVLDMMTAGLAVIVMALGVATRSNATPTIGLSLLSVAGFGTTVQNLIRHWTQLEISMAAVERVRSFQTSTPAEASSPSTPRTSFDDKTGNGTGTVQFDNVSARYRRSLPLALRQISFSVQSGQRYAICGRTGSGKSSLLATLLRLIDVEEGLITVDDLDISTMTPDDLRRRFITLPQEPVLISGSVRHNMQIYEPDTKDADMMAALDEFGLWDTIRNKGGLDVPLNDELLSHGQRQLFCFARSRLQRGNIVVLDEPSSQFDRDTELKMENAIREKFNSHTMICIAHKLSSILDFDCVLVMEAGSIVESGNPQALLQDPASVFASFYRQSQRSNGE